MQRLTALALVSVLTAACSTSGSGPGGGDDGSPWGEGFGDPDNPVPQSSDKGPYEVKTMMDFTAEQLVPTQVEQVITVLRAFGQNPAKGLIKAADIGVLPVLEELYSALPSALQDQFEGWVNGELDKVRINGKTLQEYAAQAAMYAEYALTKFEIDSDLAITPTATTHTLTAIDFTPTGIDFRIPISGIASDILTQHPTVKVDLGGALSLGDEQFGLLLGEYSWAGFNAGMTKVFGNDLETTLKTSINCASVAHSVAGKCLPFTSICVGHESLVEGVCSGARDLFVQQLHALFATLNLDAFRMKSGTAVMIDDDQDGIADRITDGQWNSQMNIGLGLRDAPATFTATRSGATPAAQ